MKTKISLIVCILFFGITNAQKLDKNVSILKKWNIENRQDFPSKTVFKITENGKTKSVYLVLNKEEVLLKDALTKGTIERYVYKSKLVTSSNCQIQEQNQWDDFKNNVYPGIIANVNKTCKAQRYCLQIFCNGIPKSSFMLIIKPTVRCPVEEITYIISD
jgi:hypothetical protein